MQNIICLTGPNYQPDILKHVKHLWGQVGVLHIKLCEICLQQRGRRLLGLQGRGLLLYPQYPVIYWAHQNFVLVQRFALSTWRQTVIAFKAPVLPNTIQSIKEYLRAILKTLGLFRGRCLETEVDKGVEDRVWTWKNAREKKWIGYKSTLCEMGGILLRMTR